ncbi:hypothetical protein K437DRAFT_257288 [Tilletiaria anomala UBC 951]|uniref:Vacuole protein n=1 Tax=Tilletiaria anomala (strain ATCC 24038 / CBS 436.72 / UBC 951) TaxID=1037660 RepID=A0A066VUG2_TILAU|nr:uncharacterized protein K437DRAFT_257288 [Tilletiaria anomala UBC 951]KDN43898.1 hypothetical protein K437DRAFT_257288 [Tilletiaria anomala UBC 951]
MCFCGHSADWKREEVPDHKFDFIDVRDYRSRGCLTQLRYGLLWSLIAKSFAVYIADIYTAVTLLAIGHFRSSIYQNCDKNGGSSFYVSIDYSKWIFCGCILFSFLLLAYEAHKTRAIVRSRDISYAYTNVMANNYYSMRSYNHFCFFCQINNSKKKKDEFAFFIFFTFKGWKRLLVADGPRQTINALTLFNFAKCKGFSTEFSDYYEGSWLTAALLITMLFTVLVFAASMILLLIAGLMYLPMLCYIKGNLKEYCCHKIDKRISELVRFKKKQRLAKQAAIARREAEGDFSHLKNKKGEIVGRAIPQPTLPTLDVDLLADDSKASNPNSAAGSVVGHKRVGSVASAMVPPGDVPGMGFAESPGFPPGAFIGMGMTPPASTIGHYDNGGGGGMYGGADENASSAHLVAHAGYAGGMGGAGVAGTDGWSTPNTLSPDAMPVRIQGHMHDLVGNGGGDWAPSHGHGQMVPPCAPFADPYGYPPDHAAAGYSPKLAPVQSHSQQGWPLGSRSASGPVSRSVSESGSAAAAAPPMAPAPTMVADVGLDFPPLQHAQTSGVQGLEYPPPMPPQAQAGPQRRQQLPDLGAYMPYAEEQLPDHRQYQPHQQKQQQPYAHQGYGQAYGQQGSFQEPSAEQYQMQARQPVPLIYPSSHADADAEAEEGSSFFAQLRAGSAPPPQQQQHLHSEAAHHGGASFDGGGRGGGVSGSSRQSSMNFEDIYAQYVSGAAGEDEPQQQPLGGGGGKHDSVLDTYYDR